MVETFIKIKGYNKNVRCKYCGAKIKIANQNQQVCERCGYRGKNSLKKSMMRCDET